MATCGPSWAARAQDEPLPDAQSAAPVELAAPEEAPGARAGAARALRIVDAEGQLLKGNFSEPAWETRGDGLFFTLEAGGARNVWRAFPDPRDASRYPRWRALPITRYALPLFAASACPLGGGRALLILSNAASPRGAAQVTLLDSRQRLTALTNEMFGVISFSPAPDGQSFAFDSARWNTAAREGTSLTPFNVVSWAVRRQNMGARAPLPEPALIERDARRPVWQGSESLLVERRSDGCILRVPAGDVRPADRSGIKIAEGSQVSASRDGSTLVIVKKSGATSRLFLLAGDGSGLRALGGTEGAQSPALSGDGQLLAYTAPLFGENRAETTLALWIMPIQPASRVAIEAPLAPFIPAPPVSTPVAAAPVGIPVAPSVSAFGAPQILQNAAPAHPVAAKNRGAAPVAQIRGVESVGGNTLRILGLASGEGASATLEIGPGLNPKRMEAWRIPLPLAPGAPLFLWTPPASARGLWSLRLSVSGSGGAAQSQFSVRLPLAPRAGAARPTTSGPTTFGSTTFGSMPAGGPLPSAPLPDLPAAPLPFPAPLPPLLPAPPTRDTAPNSSNPAPVRAPRPNLPAPAPNTSPTFLPRPNAAPGANSNPAPGANAGRDATGRDATGRDATGRDATGRDAAAFDAATFNVSNTLAEMSVGQHVTVTFWGLNHGNRAWDASAGRGGLVRLVTRWVRFEGGNRNGWTYQNLKTPVTPGARTRWSFDLTAPAQPGRYKLIYALQRVPSNSWAPPAYNAPQETWPDDFAAIAFAVVVKPAS